MKIIFHSKQLDVRGTCVSLYDYAFYHEKLLGGKSVILTSKIHNHDEMVLQKFARQFEVRFYTDELDIDSLVSDCNIFYTIKYGKISDSYIPKTIKTCVHCVFDLSEPHGDVYAAVSETLAKKFNHPIFVPHMIGLIPEKPSEKVETLRDFLKIPPKCIVFGRHGGEDTFDLQMAKNAIIRTVLSRQDIHFVFVNTPCFISHQNVHHIHKIINMSEKNRFIMTCDAMIHAQSLGETFGIAIGEFSVNNKPIIAYNGPVWNDNYKKILGDKALWYTTEDECYTILNTFNPLEYSNKDMNCYKEFSPEKVMEKFKNVFMC